jgi:tRNA U34 5-carboxymethylaminomethyl modifying GTPase MnmE/TrmE
MAQEATLRSIEGRSQKSEAVTQQALSSLRDKVEALTGVHLKAGEKMKSVKRAHNAQIQSLDEKFNKAEAATQQTLNILRRELNRTWSQCIMCCLHTQRT